MDTEVLHARGMGQEAGAIACKTGGIMREKDIIPRQLYTLFWRSEKAKERLEATTD